MIFPFLFSALFTVIFRKFSRKAYRRVKDGTTDINTFLSENLSGMKIIQAFNREDRKMEEFSGKNNALGRAKRDQIFVFGIFRPVVYMLYMASVMGLFYLGARGVIKDVSSDSAAVSGEHSSSLSCSSKTRSKTVPVHSLGHLLPLC